MRGIAHCGHKEHKVETYLIVDKQHVKQRMKPKRQSLRQLVLERRSNNSSKFDIRRGEEEELTMIRNQTENSLVPLASKRLSSVEDSIVLDSSRPLPSFRITTIDDVKYTKSDKVCAYSFLSLLICFSNEICLNFWTDRRPDFDWRHLRRRQVSISPATFWCAIVNLIVFRQRVYSVSDDFLHREGSLFRREWKLSKSRD